MALGKVDAAVCERVTWIAGVRRDARQCMARMVSQSHTLLMGLCHNTLQFLNSLWLIVALWMALVGV